MDSELKHKIKVMLVESLMLKMEPEEIGDAQPLFGADGLGLDSIDALEMVVAMEKRFGVGVPDSATARTALASVDAIHDYILSQKNEAEDIF